VRLGVGVVADGFDFDSGVRVQTHVHDDHLARFEDSKATGRVVCSKATRELLIAMKNADLKYRSNFIGLEYGEVWTFEDASGNAATVELLPSGHMVGAAQVAVTAADGYRTGYSGDFSWPLTETMSVNELVLDATYGSPDTNRRRYDQQQAEERFVEESLRRSKEGPLVIYAHRGTLQRAISLLEDSCRLPMLGSRAQRAESTVCAKFGFVQAELLDPESELGRAARASGAYVEFIGTGDPQREMKSNEHRIRLSASITQMGDPYLDITPRYCRIALSDHADFDGTMEYVSAVAPDLVLTDASRSPHHAVQLAEAIHAQLGIPAEAAPAAP
jgi:putative mRNA 3-end processing factor